MVSTPQKCFLVRLRCSRAGCYHPAQVCYMVWGGREGGEGRRRWGRGGWGGGVDVPPLSLFLPPTDSLSRSVSLCVCGVATRRCSLSPHSSSRLLGHLSPALPYLTPPAPPASRPAPFAVSLPSLITLSSSVTTFSPIRRPSLSLSLSQHH